MNSYRPRPNAVPWPPLIMAAAIALAWGAAHLQPLRLIFLPLTWSVAIGAVLFVAGAALDLWAMRTLHAGGTAILPNRRARHLVTTGPYAYGRNPIYLGNALVIFGIGFMLGSLWFAIAGIAATLATDRLAVRREERHLLALFGADYEVYCRRTRRWF
ncbi:MAG: methyltransferase family protein [Pararhizobium sp.]